MSIIVMNLIIGTGLIAEEYIKILINMDIKFDVVGNTMQKSNKISEIYHLNCFSGGIENFNFEKEYENIIIATPIKLLYSHLMIVLQNCKSVKNILIEKPGCLYNYQFEKIINFKKEINCNIYIAYNRRFYSSLEKCKELIKSNKIVNSELEINEYKMNDEKNYHSREVLENWFNCMTTHVVDMFFNIIGNPIELNCNNEGIGSLEWHNRCSIYSGKGVSTNNVPFKYLGDWNNSGKWKIKLFLENNKILEFQPLEDLKIIENNIETIHKRDKIDVDYKPGFYKQVESFFTNKNNLKTVEEQYLDCTNIYDKISNYNEPYQVMIIGLGNIGFRHLHAIIGTNLNIRLHLVEINSDNINRCRSYLNENNFSNYTFHSNIMNIKSVRTFEIIIVSTCSDIRLKLVNDIANNDYIKTINNLVLEKIIFTDYNDFDKMESIISTKVNLENIYCSSDWYSRFNLNNLDKEYNLSNSKIYVYGNNWGIGCNSIHAIMCFLKIFPTFNFQTQDIKIIDTKRENFKEITGKFLDNNLTIEDSDKFDFPLSLEITTDSNKIFLNMSKTFESINVKITDNSDKIINQYDIKEQYLSSHYIEEYKNMIFKDSIKLIDYEIAKKGHKILIDTLKPIFKDYEKIPIT